MFDFVSCWILSVHEVGAKVFVYPGRSGSRQEEVKTNFFVLNQLVLSGFPSLRF